MTIRFNPVLGCDPVHTGCKNCYAQRYFRWMGIVGKRRRTTDDYWKKPLRWNRAAACNCGAAGHGPGECSWCSKGCPRPRVFMSLCDPFEDWAGPIVNAKGNTLLCDAPGSYVTADDYPSSLQPGMATMAGIHRDMFGVIDRCQNLDWVLLTKRPENAGRATFGWPTSLMPYKTSDGSTGVCQRLLNVWLLYSASDQETLEAGIGHLLKCRGLVPVLGLSLEPLLGPIDLTPWLDSLDWVIVGGESGPGARPCNLADVRDVRDQCKAASVPLFIKQFGSNPIGIHEGQYVDYLFKHPKGGDPEEFPNDLRIRQFPSRR